MQKTARARSQTTATLAGVIGAMGIVFGDIATSPLYTLQECLTGPHGVRPEPANVLGCVSLIVWSLLLVVTIKYVAVLMQADNRGEGGILALLALVPQREREPAPGVLSATTVLVLIGAALLFGDGIITPAISVLSAVEGLRVAAPGLERAIVPATVVILAALFSVQSRGSGGLGRYFGPIMAVWLGTAFVLGVVHIIARPQALTALSPHNAIEPTVTTEEVPHVAERVEVEPIGSGLYRVLLRYGFMDEPQVHGALTRAIDRIEPGVEPAALTYVLGQECVVPGPAGRLGPVSERIYAVLARNTSNPSDFSICLSHKWSKSAGASICNRRVGCRDPLSRQEPECS